VFKKIGHIALAMLLLVSTRGVTIYHHYCGERLISATIDVRPDDCCKGACTDCQTNSVNLKVKTKFVSTYIPFDFKPKQITLPDLPIIPENLFHSYYMIGPRTEAGLGIKHIKIKPLLAEDSEAFLQVFLV